MKEERLWSNDALDAFLRIQTLLHHAAWGKFMSSVLKSDTSPERDTGSSMQTMIESNLSIIRASNPNVWFTIQNGPIGSTKKLPFQVFEKVAEPYNADQIKWWPINFTSREKCQQWINQKVKQEE